MLPQLFSVSCHIWQRERPEADREGGVQWVQGAAGDGDPRECRGDWRGLLQFVFSVSCHIWQRERPGADRELGVQ